MDSLKNASVNPGRFRSRIGILQVTETQGDTNELQQSWSIYAQAWAEIDEYAGGEAYQSQAVEATRKVKFIFHYVAGLDTKMRIQFRSRTFDINLIENVEQRNRLQVVTALERLYDESGERIQ